MRFFSLDREIERDRTICSVRIQDTPGYISLSRTFQDCRIAEEEGKEKKIFILFPWTQNEDYSRSDDRGGGS